MASKGRTIPIQAPVLGGLAVAHSKLTRMMPARNLDPVLDRAISPTQTSDLLIFHNAADRIWCEHLAERIRCERSMNRQFIAHLANWNFSGKDDSLAEAENGLRISRFFGIVVSRRMLQEDWHALEKLILVLSDLGLAKGRIVPILKENVTMPPFLRLQEWIDFRDGHPLEESACHLLTLLRESPATPDRIPRLAIGAGSGQPTEPAWKARPLFAGARKVSERIVSNLFPVVEIPKDIYSAETRFHTESEIVEACGGPGPLPFLLKGSRIYAVAPLAENSVFAPALKADSNCRQERFAEWLSDPERTPWALELLNHLLRHHAWKRGMRFDESHGLFYFTRSKPKNLWWEIGGKTIQREVTAPHTKWNQIEGHGMAEFQCGWKHEAIRANFIQTLGALFLCLEPTWFLTELDGRTPATTQSVRALDSFPAEEMNGQILRALRFWSAVFAKGHRELRIDAGTNPIRVRLTPACCSSQTVIPNDQMDFDNLALTDLSDAQLIPELGPMEW